ncbi:MAG: alpha/beta hydrolase [Pseudomonadota bacterium]
MISKAIWIGGALVLVLGAVMACSPLTVLNAVTPSATYDRAAGLAYGDHPRQRLDIYTPRDLKGPAPVVLFFYGGTWRTGERGDYAFVGEALASRGMVAVVADYRLYPEVRYPAFLEDGALALAWTRERIAQYGGDPDALFLMGHSSGAYNAAMLALDKRLLAAVDLAPSLVRGWIGLAGPYDFLPIENPDVKPVFFHPDTPVDSQPINQVGPDAPPALLIAAEKDKLVDPRRNTGGLAEALRGAGVMVEEVYDDGTNHMTLVGALSRPLRSLGPVLERVEAFVESDGGRRAP